MPPSKVLSTDIMTQVENPKCDFDRSVKTEMHYKYRVQLPSPMCLKYRKQNLYL